MRLGVLDVGSNTVHLLVVDAHPGARPLPAYSHKAELRLAQLLDADGAISAEGVERLVATVADATRVAEDKGAEDVLPFATSAVREAANGEAVLARVEQETGVRLTVLSGEDESRLTFLAVRRWFGWSAGKLLVLDIGGGSLEVGYGMDEYPDAAVSLPLGAGRLTSGWLPGDPPDAQDVRGLRRHVRTEIARTVAEFARLGPADHAVGTSKTFRQLARIAGAARSADGLYVQRVLRREALEEWVPRLAGMAARRRANLPGVSEGRAGQLLAGALVAEAAMDLYGVAELEICPWALREGVILRKLDVMAAGIAGAGPGAGAAAGPGAAAGAGAAPTAPGTRAPQGPVANATPHAAPYAPPVPTPPRNGGSAATVARRSG